MKRREIEEARRRNEEEFARGWRAAQELFQRLQSGQALDPLPYSSGLLLQAGETEYAAADAELLRYYGLEGGTYVHSTFLMGGPFLLPATAIASALGNRSRRAAAEAESMAKWRYEGSTRTVLTSTRVLVSSAGQWVSFYLGGILEVHPHPGSASLTMAFEGCPPMSLRGPWIPYLSVALCYLVHGRADPRAVELPPSDGAPTRRT